MATGFMGFSLAQGTSTITLIWIAQKSTEAYPVSEAKQGSP